MMNKDERIKKSYDFASDLSKQMITLSTAIITLCVAFTDKVFTSEASQVYSNYLWWSLFAFVVSISSGIFHLMGLTGQLGKVDNSQSTTPAHSLSELQQKAGEDASTVDTDSTIQRNEAQSDVESITNNDDLNIYSFSNRCTSVIQVLTFIIGLGLSLTYLFNSIHSAHKDIEPKKEIVDSTNCLKILRTSEYVIVNGEKRDTLYLLKDN